jgi:hypothetical protein
MRNRYALQVELSKIRQKCQSASKMEKSMVFCVKSLISIKSTKINKANFHPRIKKNQWGAEWQSAEKDIRTTYCTVQQDIIDWWMYSMRD